MASKIDISALTLNQEEVKDLSKAIFEKAFVLAGARLDQLHNVQTGISWDEQILFMSQFGLIGEALTDCDPAAATNAVTASDKTWSPKDAGFRLVHCAKDLDKDFKAFKRQVKMIDWWDEVEDEVGGYITFRALEALEKMIFRLAWFGDTGAALATGGGVLTAGTATKYFTVLDGLWVQLQAAKEAAGSIAANSGANYAAQDTLAADAAKVALRTAYDAADPRMSDQPGLMFLVTDSLYKNYMNWLADTASSQGGYMERTENGTPRLFYNQVEIIKVPEWDRIIRAYEDNGETYNNPHRLVLTVKENIPLGIMDNESLAQLDSFYDRKEKKNYFDAAVRMDVKVLEDYMFEYVI